VQIEPVVFTAEGPPAYGGVATPGALATQPYTLTVTQ